MDTTKNYEQLGKAVAVQATKDFAKGSAKNKNAVIKDLKSSWMEFITDGMSIHLAKALETNPKEVIKRFNKALAKEMEE